jgi:hypothetical protein
VQLIGRRNVRRAGLGVVHNHPCDHRRLRSRHGRVVVGCEAMHREDPGDYREYAE